MLVHGHHWRKEAGLLVLAAGAWSGLIPGLPPCPCGRCAARCCCWAGSTGPGGQRAAGGTSTRCAAAPPACWWARPSRRPASTSTRRWRGSSGLLAFARRLCPGSAEQRLETVWAGLRPGTPDDLPILGRLPGWPAIAATGHFRNGILLAPWTARAGGRLAFRERKRNPRASRPQRFPHSRLTIPASERTITRSRIRSGRRRGLE